jgi:uncharacterized protein with GYD domain
MSQYLVKMTLTTQAWAALVEEPQDRSKAVRPMFDALELKLLDYWFAVDQGAIYCHYEGPDNLIDELAMEMAILGGGTVASVESTRLLTATEAVEAMKKAKSLGYRPAITPGKK